MEAQQKASAAPKPTVSFGQEHFGTSQFGDRRLTRRSVITADALLRHPGGTPPQKLTKAELLGFYDFANNPKVNHQRVLAVHCQRTMHLASQSPGPVLFIHDTTEADYSGLDIEDLGPIGNGHCRGLLLHNVLAVDYQSREVLGLAAQVIHRRRKVPKGERLAAKRQHPQRESRLWIKGVQAVGQAPAGMRWINLMDRGGDSFESLEWQQTLGQGFVVRSKSNRNVLVPDAKGRWWRRKLHGWAGKLPELGQRTVTVAAQANQPAREARVRVAAGRMRVLAPHPKRGEHGDAPLELWVVHVKEIEPPAGVAQLEWILLTNVPTQSQQEAWERVDWYECRPIIEEYHKAQKTGCGIQDLQFTTRKALEVSVGMLSVVAVQLLRLRDLGRRDDAQQRPATEVVSAEYVEALSLWRFKQAKPQMSVKEFLWTLGRLGGYLNRPSDRPPGWLVLWRGWMELQRLVEGVALARLKISGST